MTIYTDNDTATVRHNVCDYSPNLYGIVKNSAALGWHNSSIVSNVRFNGWDELINENSNKLDKKSVEDVFSVYGIDYVKVPNSGIDKNVFNQIIADKKNVLAIEQELCSVKSGSSEWLLMQSVKTLSNPISLFVILLLVFVTCFLVKKWRIKARSATLSDLKNKRR